MDTRPININRLRVDSRHSLTLFRWITDNECHVIWLDNFNKMYRTRMIDMLKNTGTLQKMNWTGIATKRFAFPDQVDDSVMRDVTGQIIPGVASNPFAYINELHNLLFQMTSNKEPGKAMEYLRLNAGSLMRVWNAQTVPLKPEVSRMNAALRPAFLASHDKMANFHPVGLSRENIGSNEGLAKVLCRREHIR